jgi:hypothetical protein
MMLERLAERIQRARADVAVDDAERAEGECTHPGGVPVPASVVSVVLVVLVRRVVLGFVVLGFVADRGLARCCL